MKTAIITAFHKYQPYGGEYYAPILDFYVQTMKKYKSEYDQLYLVDSNWEIPQSPDYAVLKVNPHLRYYDAYKSVLPQIKEDLVLFLDNDMVIYKPKVISTIFDRITPARSCQLVSIYDTIGERTDQRLNGKSKFCLYLFATYKNLLMKYRDCEWGPVHWGETLSELTYKILDNELSGNYEQEEDKSSIYFDGVQDGEKSKDLGYMHIRSGSVPSVLLAWKENAPQTYWEYIKGQPKTEYLRQCFWYDYMNRKTIEGIWGMTEMGMDFYLMLTDMKVEIEEWEDYYNKCVEYYGLE